MKFRLLPVTLTVLLGLYLTSCTEETDTLNDVNAVIEDTTEVVSAAEIDEIDAVLGDLIIDSFESADSFDSPGSSIATRIMQPPSLPACVTVTVTIQQNFRELLIDFGTEGCNIRGNLLRGQIQVTYNRDPEAQEVLINYTLIDFFFNAKSIEANRTILRQRSNENGNPMFTHTLDITVTWPNGASASRQGAKIREWIEGTGSSIFSDNVFEVIGNWTTTFVNGHTHSYEVVEPLRREVICLYFVSGAIGVERTNFGGVLDYGDGDCDNEATFTFNNGNEIQITLN
ncbi:MAG: hypothetical protein AAGH46_00775 [Bacteroidota bacterium]